MRFHIVSVLADFHDQLTNTSGVQLQPQIECIIPLPDPLTVRSKYIEEVISQWSAGSSLRPPTWRELLQVLQDIGQLKLRQQIEAFMIGMCTDMYTCIVTNFIFSFDNKNGQFFINFKLLAALQHALLNYID